MTSPLRLFVALPVTDEVRDAMTAARAQLESEQMEADIRWQDPSRCHLTLKFLGAVNERQLPNYGRLLADAARRSVPLTLTTSGFGAFPSLSRPSVLWIGVDGSLGELHRLQRGIDERIGPTSSSAARPSSFHPHLTLGRVRNLTGTARGSLARLLAQTRPEAATWVATSVQLLSSNLRPDGADHRVLDEFDLGRLAGSTGVG